MTASTFDFKARWVRAASSMQAHGVDALFVMKPANLAYLTGDGRPCALGLLTRNLQCIVAVPASDVRSVRMASAATAKKCPRPSKFSLPSPIMRNHASCTSAVGWSVCPGDSWAIL